MTHEGWYAIKQRNQTKPNIYVYGIRIVESPNKDQNTRIL